MPSNAVPPRVQLLGAIAQCNAFQVPLPLEDSSWKRALLWPLVVRVADASDRDALFEDPEPLSSVSAFFPLSALLNHSCDPAAAIDCEWPEGAPAPRACVRALRYIPAGTEVTHSYLRASTLGSPADATGAAAGSPTLGAIASSGSTLPLEERRRTLLGTYGFVCCCLCCASEMPGAGKAGHDPLLDAGHFPEGVGLRGQAAYFSRGGKYPEECSGEVSSD